LRRRNERNVNFTGCTAAACAYITSFRPITSFRSSRLPTHFYRFVVSVDKPGKLRKATLSHRSKLERKRTPTCTFNAKTKVRSLARMSIALLTDPMGRHSECLSLRFDSVATPVLEQALLKSAVNRVASYVRTMQSPSPSNARSYAEHPFPAARKRSCILRTDLLGKESERRAATFYLQTFSVRSNGSSPALVIFGPDRDLCNASFESL